MNSRLRRAEPLCALAAAALAVACNVGAPLVADKPPRGDVGPIDCTLPPFCSRLDSLPSPRYSALPIGLGECGSAVACQISATPSAESTSPTLPFCVTALAAGTLPEQASCSALELRTHETELTLEGVRWSSFNLAIRSEHPLRVTLVAPQLLHVFLYLSGRVTLRITDASSLTDVRIIGVAEAQGKPLVELEQVHGQLMTALGGVTDDSQTAPSFDGAIRMHATSLEDVALDVADLSLESVVLQNGEVRADVLEAVDTNFEGVTVDADRAVLSAFGAENARFHFCSSGSVIAGTLFQSHIGVCPETVVRLYSSTFASGELAGTFEADSTLIVTSRIGVRDATRVTAFGSAFSSITLCENAELLALGARSTLECSDCDSRLDAAAVVCAPPNPPPFPFGPNYCSAWMADENPGPCEEELPGRTRPRK